MKKIILPLLWIILTLGLNAQTVQPDILSEAVKQIEESGKQIVGQAFSPLADLERDDLLFTFSPGYFRLRNWPEELTAFGNGIDGISLTAVAARGLSNRFNIYGSYSGVFISGEMQGKALTNSTDSLWTGFWNFHSLLTGCSFDALQEERLTVPIYLGMHLEAYNFEMQTSEVEVSTEEWSIFSEGLGVLFGFSGGLSTVFHFGPVDLAPYYLFMFNLNGLEGSYSGEINGSGLSPFPGGSFSAPAYSGGTLGLDFSLKKEGPWSFGASLMNLIPILRTSYDKGELLSIVCFVQYKP